MASQTRTVLSLFGVDPARIGGCESFARELSLQLGELGWRSVLCFEKLPQGAVRSFLTLPNVTLEAVPDLYANGMRQTQGVATLLRQYHPEILHLHFTGFLSPYPWLGRLAGVRKVFYTDQGSHPEGFVPRRSPWWKRAATRLINAPIRQVLCCSRYNVRCYQARGVLAEKKYTFVHNGVDFRRVSKDGDAFRRCLGVEERQLLVMQVSWMIPEKGGEDLIRAARLVVNQLPEARFALVGEGPERQRLGQLVAELGLSREVIFAGRALDPLGEGVFAAADVVCQMSRWEEAFGWVIAEAMACRKPVIGTRVGGIPEVIADGETGFLVPKGDIEAMASRLIELLKNTELRHRLGEAGYRRAQQQFNLEEQVRQIIRLYGIGEERG